MQDVLTEEECVNGKQVANAADKSILSKCFCVVRLVFVCISTVDIRFKGLARLWYQDTWLQDGCVYLPSKLG